MHDGMSLSLAGGWGPGAAARWRLAKPGQIGVTRLNPSGSRHRQLNSARWGTAHSHTLAICHTHSALSGVRIIISQAHESETEVARESRDRERAGAEEDTRYITVHASVPMVHGYVIRRLSRLASRAGLSLRLTQSLAACLLLSAQAHITNSSSRCPEKRTWDRALHLSCIGHCHKTASQTTHAGARRIGRTQALYRQPAPINASHVCAWPVAQSLTRPQPLHHASSDPPLPHARQQTRQR